jgi:MYXO-CTERM domain-containing protein
MPRLLQSFAVAALPLLCSGVALAHIDLVEPTPRYPIEVSHENKSCPCGMGTSNRRCDVPEERSDENRDMDRLTTLEAGSMLHVVFNEYVGHSGRFRVAFDKEGADLDDFNANILADIPDPPGRQGNMMPMSSMWEIDVQLPNEPCDNCTLQLIQMMDGNMTDPVPDPVGRSSYYQCADIVLTGGTTAVPEGALDSAGDDSGCSVSQRAPRGAQGTAAALLLLGASVFVRRRRR